MTARRARAEVGATKVTQVPYPVEAIMREGRRAHKAQDPAPDASGAAIAPKTMTDTPVAATGRQKRRRMPWWPYDVDSELEMKLYTRLQQAGLPLGAGQFHFALPRRFRFDRAWPQQMVACEVQGGIWTRGRHARGSGIAAECVKFSLAAALGWRVLPVTDDMIEDGTAVALIAQALEADREV